MPEPAEESPAAVRAASPVSRAPLTPLTRAVLLWSLIAVLLLAALGSAVGALQQNVYSPGGLVSAYLDALARHDAPAALALPGVNPTRAQLETADLPTRVSRELLRADLLGPLGAVRILHDVALPDGRHRVTAAYTLDGTPHTSNFTLTPDGSDAGVFTSWRFAATPLAVAHIEVLHASTFTAAGHTVDTRATSGVTGAFDNAANYLVFAPSSLRLGHRSTLLTAEPVVATVTRPGEVTKATVTTTASVAFVAQVTKQLRGYLDSCVTQEVLQPAGCPMGVVIDDRVQGVPAWSMVRYPPVTISAGADGWTMGETEATAHLRVTVQSLFDGSVSTRSEDEPFTVSLSSIVIRPDGSLAITVGG